MAATMKDIRKKTNLSLATISKYLNGGKVRPNNKKLIDQAIKELRFVPNEFARSLKTSHSKTIGVVIPELSNAFITSIITHIEDILRQHEYAVMVCDCRSDAQLERDAVAFLLRKRVDGLINMPTDQSGEHLLPAIEKDIPIVLVDRIIKPTAGRVSAVVIDNADAAERATAHLLANGHTRIGLILGNRGIYTTEKRYEGYVRALNAKHVEPQDDLLIYSDYTMEGGYNSTMRLLSLDPPPSAIFVTNYEMTIGTILALNESRVAIPDDISLIGFDKLDLFSAIYRNLALVKQPQTSIGEMVAKQLLSMLAGGPDANNQNSTIMLTSQLFTGETVKPYHGVGQDEAPGVLQKN